MLGDWIKRLGCETNGSIFDKHIMLASAVVKLCSIGAIVDI